MATVPKAESTTPTDKKKLIFLKGKENALGRQNAEGLDWAASASQVRSSLAEALNARHLSFLFGSGTSSLSTKDKGELGIPTMGPLAEEFVKGEGADGNSVFLTPAEKTILKSQLGVDRKRCSEAAFLSGCRSVMVLILQ